MLCTVLCSVVVQGTGQLRGAMCFQCVAACANYRVLVVHVV